MVEKFARALAERGRKVAILSRGYKSKRPPFWRRGWNGLTHTEEPPPRVVSDGAARAARLASRPATSPTCWRATCPGVVVLVDKNRVKAGTYAIRRFGCDTLVLDDGFQYLPLKGRLNLLLVDKTNPFGNGRLLPRGILREPIKHLRRATYVFLTKSNGRRDPELEELIQRHNPGVDIIECAHRPQYLQRRRRAAERASRSSFSRAGASAPSAASPRRRASRSSCASWARIWSARKRFLDHYRYTQRGPGPGVRPGARGRPEFLVTTEKDAVRLDETLQLPAAAVLPAPGDRDHPRRGGLPGGGRAHLLSRERPAARRWSRRGRPRPAGPALSTCGRAPPALCWRHDHRSPSGPAGRDCSRAFPPA